MCLLMLHEAVAKEVRKSSKQCTDSVGLSGNVTIQYCVKAMSIC